LVSQEEPLVAIDYEVARAPELVRHFEEENILPQLGLNPGLSKL
jgi:hypothetical protein